MLTQWKSKLALTMLPTTLFVGLQSTRANAFNLEEATIADIDQALDTGVITSAQLTQLYLNRIEAYDKQGPKLNSFITINPNALATAAALDSERKTTGSRGPLFGVPVLLKDNIDTKDMPTTAGFLGLANSIPPDDAFLTQKLRDAGAIILGKGSLTEFANFLTNGMPAGYSSLNGYTYNPYNPGPLPGGDGRPILSPGGSSAGPGAAVAANLVTIAIGTETSGSILSPANQNSLVGIKPTVGLISRDGVVPIAASQDTAGPLARTVSDAATILGLLTGVDPNDPATSTSAGKSYTDYRPFLDSKALAGKRIGVPKASFWNNLSTEQRNIVNAAITVMEKQGATFVYEDISTVPLGGSTVLSYEFKRDLNAYLATLGPNSPIKTIDDVDAFITNYLNNNPDPNGPFKYGKVQVSLSKARDLSPGSADTIQYLKDRANDILTARTNGIDLYIDTNKLDAVLFPGTTGANIGARAGYPSIIVPAGYQSNLAPYGVTFLGKAYSEPSLIGLAYSYEQNSLVRQAPTNTPALAGESIAVPEPTILPAVGVVLLGSMTLRLTKKRKV